MNLFTKQKQTSLERYCKKKKKKKKQKQTQRYRKQTYGYQRGKEGEG